MSEPKVLACPKCGAPTSFGASFCVYCRTPLNWGAMPMLARGRLIAQMDGTRDVFSKRELIGLEKTPNGAVATVEARKAANGVVGPRRRHGCVVVHAASLDAHAAVGVAGRQQESTASGGYSLSVAPHFRTVNLAKVAASREHVYFTQLHAWEFQPNVRRTGELNEIELRMADSIIQVFVNGHHIAACIDATYGFGAFGWRIQSLTGMPARVCIRSIALYEVA